MRSLLQSDKECFFGADLSLICIDTVSSKASFQQAKCFMIIQGSVMFAKSKY
jgi:hypothetical protein